MAGGLKRDGREPRGLDRVGQAKLTKDTTRSWAGWGWTRPQSSMGTGARQIFSLINCPFVHKVACDARIWNENFTFSVLISFLKAYTGS